jgi:hypothetical protein
MMDINREKLAALTDDELLTRYRRKHGNPYMPLSMAEKLCLFDAKYRHLGALVTKRQQEAQEKERQRLRAKVFPADGQ